MFFEKGRITVMREMILADTDAERQAALDLLLPMQRADFVELFEIMRGLPVTIRLLDPPLHEFLPKTDEEIRQVAADLGYEAGAVAFRLQELAEYNPMLGHRGTRLGVTYPEIYETQVRAIIEAACEVSREGVRAVPEIMIPIVAIDTELHRMRELAIETAETVLKEQACEIEYSVGTMIELPRACIIADQLAEEADFFSFGTNDLTQSTWGFSRDDSPRFLPFYIENGLLEVDPFVRLDPVGVGELMRMAIARGRKVKPGLKMGICGEHGGDPQSVEFCHREGLNYVSCSPFRVPIARVAAAQAVARERAQGGISAQ
jgi:pyruvate,orthophosphate dikinase